MPPCLYWSLSPPFWGQCVPINAHIHGFHSDVTHACIPHLVRQESCLCGRTPVVISPSQFSERPGQSNSLIKNFSHVMESCHRCTQKQYVHVDSLVCHFPNPSAYNTRLQKKWISWIANWRVYACSYLHIRQQNIALLSTLSPHGICSHISLSWPVHSKMYNINNKVFEYWLHYFSKINVVLYFSSSICNI